MFLARKISRAKWDASQELEDGEISADAITGDLRTHGNTLSFWRLQTTANGDIEDMALAIAAGGERIDRLDVIWLTERDLQVDGLALMPTVGRTPVSELASRHVDVVKLDYLRLGKVARHVAGAINDRRYRRFTRARVKRLLSTAVEQGRINVRELAERIQTEIAA